MPQLLIILLKINLVLLLFAGSYYLVLRKVTFYTVNRFFLVIGIIFSTIYPFINLTKFFLEEDKFNSQIIKLLPQANINDLAQISATHNHWNLLLNLFCTGISLMLIRFICQLFSLYKIHKKSKPGIVNSLKVRLLDSSESPFSFWQTIYINPHNHPQNELAHILEHEHIHIKQWHTIDILVAELSVILYWFNPGVWLMKKAIKENLEFLTDAKIIKKGVNKKTYQYSLLGVTDLQTQVSLVNHFNILDLKVRIKMMNLNPSSPKKIIFYVIILPVLLSISLAFTIDKTQFNSNIVLVKRFLNDQSVKTKPKVAILNPISLSVSKLNKADVSQLPKNSGKLNSILKEAFTALDSIKISSIKKVRAYIITTKDNDLDTAHSNKQVHFYNINTDSVTFKNEKVKDVKLNIRFIKGDAKMSDKSKSVFPNIAINRDFTNLSDSGKINYFLNGKKMDAVLFKNTVGADKIKEIKIVKNDTGESTIHILTKDNSSL